MSKASPQESSAAVPQGQNSPPDKLAHKSILAARARHFDMIVLVLILVITSVTTALIVISITGSASGNLARLYSLEVVGKFSSYLNRELFFVEKVSRSRAVTNWYASEDDPVKKEMAYNEMMDYAEMLEKSNLYIVIDKSLNEYSLIGKVPLEDLSHFERIDPSDPYNQWYYECTSSKNSYTLNIDIDKVTKLRYLWINHKVMDGSTLVGAFCSGLVFDEVINNLFIHYSAGNVIGYVIDRHGIIQMQSTPADFDPEENIHIRDKSADPAFYSVIESYLSGISDFFGNDAHPEVVKLSKGSYRYASIAPISGTDWSVVTFFNNQSLLSIVDFLPLFAVLLAAFIFYTLANNVLMHRLVITPLSQLTKNLSGSKPNTGDIYGYNQDDEIGDLARTIQDMRDRLSVYNVDILNATRERERQDQLLYAVNRTAAVLLSSEDEEKFETSLQEGMKLMALCMDVDRIYIWKNEMKDGVLHYVQLFDWMNDLGRNSNPVPSKISYPYSSNPEWEASFLRDECVNGPLSSMPLHTQELLEPCQVKSILLIPVHLHDYFWGFVNLDDCHQERTFTGEEINILRSGSLMMVNAVNRNAQAVKLHEAHERTQQLVDATPLAGNLIDSNFRNTLCNDEALKLFDMTSKEEYLDRFWDLNPKYQPDGQLSSEEGKSYLKKAFEEGRCEFEWMHQKPDGSLIPRGYPCPH